MKLLLKVLLIIVISAVIIGYYFKNSGDPFGDTIIGIGILILAFILMPLFIYHRYKDKDLSKYTFDDEDEKKSEN